MIASSAGVATTLEDRLRVRAKIRKAFKDILE